VAALYQGQRVQLAAPNNLGLVGSWNFDEGVGTIAGDTSGNKKDGTFVSSPVWISGKHGTALQFDGVGDGVNVGTIAPTTAASFSAWIYINGANSNYGAIFTNWGPGGNAFFIGTQIANPSDIEVYFNGPKIFDITNVPLNKWVYLAVTHNGTTAVAYINGVQTNSAASSLTSATGVTSLGYDVNRSNYAFKGNLDDMRIYNRALSAAEVVGLYSQGATQAQASSASLTNGSSLQSGLVGLWTFDGPDVTDKVYDRSGSGFNGYLVGTNNATSSRKTIGKMGQAFTFGGLGKGGIDVGNSSTLDPTRFTIAAWVNVTAPSTYNTNVIFSNARDCSCSNTYNGITMEIGIPGRVYIAIANSSVALLSSNSSLIATSTWTYVAATYDGSNVRFYVNGALDRTVANTTDPGTPATFDSYVGSLGYLNGTNYTFGGSLDDVRVYNRPLSAAEIKQLYLLGR